MAKFKKNGIGILGGSFDPAHKGHLLISKIAIKKVNLKKIYWIVTKKNPFKKKPTLSLKERINLAKKLTKNFKNIQILYLDETVKSSRTVDILKFIIKKMKLKSLYFIIGSDILVTLHKWKSWKKIVKLVKLVVFSRKGYDKKVKESIVLKYLKKNNLIYIKNKPIPISSTILRKRKNLSNK